MDDVAARSEARKKRILQNAESRLKKIRGLRFDKPDGEIENEENEQIAQNVPNGAPFGSEMSIDPIPSTSSSVQNRLSENSIASSSNPPNAGELTSSMSQAAQQSGDPFIARLAAVLNSVQPSPAQANSTLIEPSNWLDFILIFCLGIFVRISYNTQFAWVFKESMWVPFFAVAVPELIIAISRGPPPAGFLYSFMIMCGVPPHRVSYFFYFVIFFRKLFQFLSLYVFSFVVTHLFVRGSIPVT